MSRRSLDETARRVGASIRHVSGEDTSEVVQEALTRAFANGVALDAEPWLKTVARRIAIDRVRRRREYASGLPVELEKWASDHDGDPEEMALRAERSAEVRRALENMPKRYRDVLLTYAEEESPARVARRLGLTPKATWTLLSRARTRLRVDLERLGFVPALLGGKARWKSIFGATAAASAIAVSVALLPSGTEKVDQPGTPIVQAPEAASLSGTVDTAQANVATPIQQVVDVVEETVDKFVPSEVGRVGVKSSCVKGERLSVEGVSLTFVQTTEEPSLLGAVIEAVPEDLRRTDVDIC